MPAKGPTVGIATYYFIGNILFYNGTPLTLTKATIKQTLSSASDATLNTVYAKNQIFTDTPNYRIYTGGSVTDSNNFPYLTILPYYPYPNPYSFSVDGSQLLPIPAIDGTMVKIITNSNVIGTEI